MTVIKVHKEQLIRPLSSCSSVVDRKQTQPILNNALFDAGEEFLSITASDQQLEITHWLKSAESDQTSFTVSVKKLLDICRAAPDGSIIKLELHVNQLHISYGSCKFQLQTLPARDFPVFAKDNQSEIIFGVNQAVLKRLISEIQYAMSVQDIRYYLNGMYFYIDNNRLIAVATDGHRLAYNAINLESQGIDTTDFIIPRKTIVELFKLLKDDSDSVVEFVLSENSLKVSFADFSINSKFIDGKFPDYQRVIPVGYENGVDIDRQVFLSALNRISVLTNDKYKGVRFCLSTNQLKLVCNNNEQEEAEEDIVVEYTGDPLDIGFNVQYLIDVLSNVGGDTVRCAFGGATSSLLITIVGNSDFKYVVMPMRV